MLCLLQNDSLHHPAGPKQRLHNHRSDNKVDLFFPSACRPFHTFVNYSTVDTVMGIVVLLKYSALYKYHKTYACSELLKI